MDANLSAPARAARVLLLGLWAFGCGSADLRHAEPPRRQAPVEEQATREEATRWPALEVVDESATPPPGSDALPRLALAFRHADGRRVPIERDVRSYAPFRDGVAMVDRAGALVLVSSRGARRVLAKTAGGPPVQGPAGELVYLTRHGERSELHVLSVAGADRVLASGFASAGVLAPQLDGRVFFVAARSGGVAGVWVAGAAGARCLTNCDLGRAPWGDDYVPLPGHRDAFVVGHDRVSWTAFDGTTRSVELESESLGVESTAAPPAVEGAPPSALKEQP